MESEWLTSKKTSLVIVGITALACSRLMFLFFNDPEGPNVPVVVGMAVIIYSLSLLVFLFYHSTAGLKKILVTISVQVLIAIGFYFFLK